VAAPGPNCDVTADGARSPQIGGTGDAFDICLPQVIAYVPAEAADGLGVFRDSATPGRFRSASRRSSRAVRLTRIA
jgi:hypothetical protein